MQFRDDLLKCAVAIFLFVHFRPETFVPFASHQLLCFFLFNDCSVPVSMPSPSPLLPFATPHLATFAPLSTVQSTFNRRAVPTSTSDRACIFRRPLCLCRRSPKAWMDKRPRHRANIKSATWDDKPRPLVCAPCACLPCELTFRGKDRGEEGLTISAWEQTEKTRRSGRNTSRVD